MIVGGARRACIADVVSSFTITTACIYHHPYKRAPRNHFLPFHISYSVVLTMQGPTLTDARVRNTRDSHIIFEAVARRALPLITRRLTSSERRDFIRPGSVFVWEERGPESGSSGVSRRRLLPLASDTAYILTFFHGKIASVVQAGIERWTDGECSRGDIVLAYEISRTENPIGKQWGPSRVRDVSGGGFLLSKLTHFQSIRNSSSIMNAYRMTTWEGGLIPIGALCRSKVNT